MEEKPEVAREKLKERIKELVLDKPIYGELLKEFIRIAKNDNIFEDEENVNARARSKTFNKQLEVEIDPSSLSGRIAHLLRQKIIYKHTDMGSMTVYQLTSLPTTKKALADAEKEAKRKQLEKEVQRKQRGIDPQKYAGPRVPPPKLTEEDIKHFKEIARKKEVLDYLAPYINPKVSNMIQVKKAILIALAGGKDRHGDRQRIHILLYGPGGTAKTRLIYWVAEKLGYYKTAHRTSDVGLTGDARGSEVSPGKLVKAHRSFLAADELDKVPKDERDGLYEAMSDGVVTINVGNKDKEFPAEATVFGALNNKDVLRPALLSRFDFILNCDHPRVGKALQILKDRLMDWGKKKEGYEGKLLRKYLTWIHRYTPEFTKETRIHLWKAVKQYVQEVGGFKREDGEFKRVKIRKYERYIRIAKAIARLNHRKVKIKDLEKAWDLCQDAESYKVTTN